MKKITCILSCIFIAAFSSGQSVDEIPSWKEIFDTHGMNGTIVIYDQKSNELVGYNTAQWDSGYLPASTFKIANSLISLETGVVDTNYIFRWDGKKRWWYSHRDHDHNGLCEYRSTDGTLQAAKWESGWTRPVLPSMD